MNGEYRIVMTTTSSREIAQKIIFALLSNKLAACVQVQNVESHYVWENELCRATEQLLLIKTLAARFQEVEETILAHHDYDTPEIVEVPIVGGLSKYLRWMDDACQGSP